MKLVTGSTREAKEFVENNLYRLGKLISMEHSRDKESIEYKTVISGADETITILGGLSSGFDGGGPNGLIIVLQKLGVEDETAQNLVKGNRQERHSFKYEF